MIHRIALALLVLCLTLPAAAAPLCHATLVAPAPADQTAIDHAAMGHGKPAPTDDDRLPPPAMAKQHGCLGCAAPVAAAPAVAGNALPPHNVPVARIAVLTGIASAPALPPPRS